MLCFVNVRLVSSFILLLIGIIFFGDILSRSEMIGFVLGVVAMIFLFENRDKKEFIYKKGIIFLFLGSLVLIFTNAIAKLSSIEYDKIRHLLFWLLCVFQLF